MGTNLIAKHYLLISEVKNREIEAGKEKADGTAQASVYELMLDCIRLRAKRRKAWLKKIWTDAGESSDVYDHDKEIDGCLLGHDTPGAEAAWYATASDLAALNQELAQNEKKLAADTQSRFSQLTEIFGLSPAEADCLVACLALHLDPNLGRVYAYLQDHNGRTYVTRQLVARLFGHGFILPVSSSSPLFAWSLITAHDMGRSEPARLEADPFIVNWVMGINDLDPLLLHIAQTQPVHATLPNWPVDQVVGQLEKLLARPVQPVRLFIAGAAGSGRRSFAAIISKKLGMPLLAIQTDRMTPDQWPLVYMRSQRQSRLYHCTLLWDGEISKKNNWPQQPGASRLQFVTGETDESVIASEPLVDLRIELGPLSAASAQHLWQKIVPSAAQWPEEELLQLIKRQQAGIGQIIQVSRQDVNTVAEASEALRSASRQRLGELAQHINSSFSWHDLVVTPLLRNNLDELYFEAGERSAIWQNEAVKKLFPQGRGLLALFTGAPGTGKTMAAQVIANSLQLDIFRIDLSAIISKYIGETSKNLERILSRASRMDIVLFFDEADSLFGKRTEIKDAHDRYANTDTNYLLQAIEEYPGIAILATNKSGNIDPAFTRRLRYVLDFPKPDAQQRLQLWRQLVLELTGKKNAAKIDTQLIDLSETIEVTGAQIKQAILTAIFLARKENKPMAAPYLFRGLERELAKDGRDIGRRGRDIIAQYRNQKT